MWDKLQQMGDGPVSVLVHAGPRRVSPYDGTSLLNVGLSTRMAQCSFSLVLIFGSVFLMLIIVCVCARACTCVFVCAHVCACVHVCSALVHPQQLFECP